MTAESKVRIWCDAPACTEWREGAFRESAMTVRARLARLGWTIAPEFHYEPDYCPAHGQAAPEHNDMTEAELVGAWGGSQA